MAEVEQTGYEFTRCMQCKSVVEENQLYCALCSPKLNAAKKEILPKLLKTARWILTVIIPSTGLLIGILVPLGFSILSLLMLPFAEGYAGRQPSSVEWFLLSGSLFVVAVFSGSVFLSGLLWIPANRYRRIAFYICLTALGISLLSALTLRLTLTG